MSLSQYINVKIQCHEDFRDILIAELSYLDFDSMMETESGLEAYIIQDKFDERELVDLTERYKMAGVHYSIEVVNEKNWNEEWEKNYDPIRVEDKILVRATFHPSNQGFDYELIINPRMSFGTGHHATTYLMLQNMLTLDFNNKKVLDAGCGTAILAIMAEKLGAIDVLAYDIDSWSTENAPENIALNQCQAIEIQEGTINTISLNSPYDIILANINKNVLLEEMNDYFENLKNGGMLCLSGFYLADNQDMISKAAQLGFTFQKSSDRNDWSSLIFSKL